MACRDFRRGAVAIRKVRETTWVGFQPLETTVAVSTVVLVFTLNAAALALRPFTVVRSHFMISVRSDQAAAAEVQRCAMGLAVVSDQAVAVGATAVPAPITESPSHLWFLHTLLFAASSSVVDLARPEGLFSIDSKAMRKVEVGSDIVLVLENGAAGISAGAVITVGGRMLVKNS